MKNMLREIVKDTEENITINIGHKATKGDIITYLSRRVDGDKNKISANKVVKILYRVLTYYRPAKDGGTKFDLDMLSKTKKQLAKELGMSPRTIERGMVALQAQHLILQILRQHKIKGVNANCVPYYEPILENIFTKNIRVSEAILSNTYDAALPHGCAVEHHIISPIESLDTSDNDLDPSDNDTAENLSGSSIVAMNTTNPSDVVRLNIPEKNDLGLSELLDQLGGNNNSKTTDSNNSKTTDSRIFKRFKLETMRKKMIDHKRDHSVI